MTHVLERAILIDDEIIDHRLYRKVASRSGLITTLECFVYAEEALAHLREDTHTRVDAIFLDINMPRMNGFEFLDALTSELPERLEQTVIVMLTTSTDPRDRARAAGYACVSDFLNKPLRAEEIAAVAKLASERRSALLSAAG
ncbi:MAG: response regulator [Pseudomonadota bacterium]